MEATWDGSMRRESLNDWVVIARNALADAAKNYDWPRVFEILSEHQEFVNTWRLGGTSLYAPLHQAAYGGAPVDVVQQLLRLGAWRTLQNARGERPVDVAARKGHAHLLAILAPEYKRDVPLGVLLKIQAHFHEVICGRADRLVREHDLRLPELEPLLELENSEIWFPVPGMMGGFKFRLESPGVDAKLVSESWCRAAEGSGERHEITSAGSRLVEKGFV